MPSPHGLLINAFKPGKEIDDPNLFAGRRAEIEDLASALHSEGICPIIYGDPGLGKSSLALQMWRIATGDTTLLNILGMSYMAFSSSFLAFYIPCTDEIRNKEDLLGRVVHSLNAVESKVAGRRMNLVDSTTRRKISVKLFETERVTRREMTERNDPSRTIEEQVFYGTAELSERYGQPVLLIIDELDRVSDTTGLASFIKSMSSPTLRFMLVGIADNITDLIADHGSIERIAVPVHVNRMSGAELQQIIHRTLSVLADHGLKFSFESAAIEEIVSCSAGFPWFVHLLGQGSLLLAARDKATIVTTKHVRRAKTELTRRRFDQPFSDRYTNAVGDSSKREIVLRIFAHALARDIRTSDIYGVLRNVLQIPNPASYKTQLSGERRGKVLYTVPSVRGVTRFSNEMFKVYIRLRPSLHRGVDETVHRALAQVGRPDRFAP